MVRSSNVENDGLSKKIGEKKMYEQIYRSQSIYATPFSKCAEMGNKCAFLAKKRVGSR